MKLTFSTLGCPDWSWERIVEEASRLGYQGLEIRGIEGELYLPAIEYFTPGRLERTLARLAQKNLEIMCLDTSVKFHIPDKWESFLREGLETIDLAHRMGVPFVRVQGDAFPDPARRDETMAAIVEGFRRLCAHANPLGVVNLIEVHGDFNRVEPLVEALEKTGSSSLAIMWDIEHTHKVYGERWRDFYEPLKEYVKHVHIKDIRMNDLAPNGKPRHCLMGEGDVPIRDIVATLAEDGYEGYLSLEWEKKWNPWIEEPEVAIPQYTAYMSELLRSLAASPLTTKENA
jgi:sugar phosphate isomerase/epimerase